MTSPAVGHRAVTASRLVRARSSSARRGFCRVLPLGPCGHPVRLAPRPARPGARNTGLPLPPPSGPGPARPLWTFDLVESEFLPVRRDRRGVRRARVAIGSCNRAGCSAYCPHSGGEHPASPRLADSDDRSGRDRPWRAWKLHYPRHPRALIVGRHSGGLTRSTGSTDGEVAAVGHDGCTGDIARVLRQQEPDHRSDVVRRIAEVTERMASEYPLRQRRVRSHRQLHGG
jgi:hypothetical protein